MNVSSILFGSVLFTTAAFAAVTQENLDSSAEFLNKLWSKNNKALLDKITDAVCKTDTRLAYLKLNSPKALAAFKAIGNQAPKYITSKKGNPIPADISGSFAKVKAAVQSDTVAAFDACFQCLNDVSLFAPKNPDFECDLDKLALDFKDVLVMAIDENKTKLTKPEEEMMKKLKEVCTGKASDGKAPGTGKDKDDKSKGKDENSKEEDGKSNALYIAVPVAIVGIVGVAIVFFVFVRKPKATLESA